MDELQMANGTNLVYQGLSRTGELYRPAILPNSIFPHSAMRNTTIHTQPLETRHTKRIDYGTSLGFHHEASPPKEKWRWITDGIFEKMGWVLRSRIQDPVEVKSSRDWWFEKVWIHEWEGSDETAALFVFKDQLQTQASGLSPRFRQGSGLPLLSTPCDFPSYPASRRCRCATQHNWAIRRLDNQHV